MKTSNSQAVKIHNTNLVIEKLVELRETSRIELARITTLNKATVSSIISDLLDREIVIETGSSVKTSGRSAKVVALNKNAGRILSLELQPQEIYGVITNLYGEILFEVHQATKEPDFSPYLKDLMNVINNLKTNTFDSKYGIIGIGIGVYGTIDNDNKIKFAPFNSWKDIDLTKIIENYTGIDTYVENEANISALGENVIYASQNNIVSLNIGIGVGIGIIINGKLYNGEDGFAGEIGHTIIHPNGNECVCGNLGCLETYIKDSAILEKYFKLSGEKIDIDEFTVRYKNKCPYAMEIYSEFIKNVTLTVNNISVMLNPKAIIINSRIIENVSESISIIKNNLKSQLMKLDILTTSRFKSKTNVLGLTHVLIKRFLNIENYAPKTIE